MFGCAGESKFQLSRGAGGGGCATEAEVEGKDVGELDVAHDHVYLEFTPELIPGVRMP